MNKKQLILVKAKQLFGTYGYLGFTLKQLAQACDMTSPALYYFYSSKADLFKDCMLSEMMIRRDVIEHGIAEATSLATFTRVLAREGIDVCGSTSFRVGEAMQEIIHLPVEMQQELRDAWNTHLIAPLESFLRRVMPALPSGVSSRLLATYLINMVTFAAAHAGEFSSEEFIAFFAAVAGGLESSSSTVR